MLAFDYSIVIVFIGEYFMATIRASPAVAFPIHDTATIGSVLEVSFANIVF